MRDPTEETPLEYGADAIRVDRVHQLGNPP